MPVTVDRSPLPAEELGLRTVGQVLSHVQQENRLVVHMLIDGEEPGPLAIAREVPVRGHTLYIETADPRKLALSVLDEVQEQLGEADRLKSEASELLQKNQAPKALERLSGCFTTWQHAQESLVKTARLLRIDLAMIDAGGQPLADMLTDFASQLRQIRSALEQRDFVLLNDLLLYETTEASRRWGAALESMRQIVLSLGGS
jgi:hypothetical protein